MKTISIEAELRDRTGKGSARAARRAGRLPGVLYGRGKSIHLSVDRRSFLRALHEGGGENVIFDVRLPGESAPLKSIAREIQHDPVTRSAIHVDFQHIDMSRPIHVQVAVHLEGEPEGVRNYGGVLEHVAREVEVLCLPSEIPSHIEVDVSPMMVGDTLHVRDLPTAGFEIVEDPSKVIAHVAAPTVEKVAAEAAEAAEEGAAEAETAPAKEEAASEAKGDGEES